MLHARLVEDLSGSPGSEIPPQETRIGRPAAVLAHERPNPMLDGRRAWLDGPVGAASK
ncbi:MULTISPECIES: hypothetical protein [unclassified Streptomyces]|uniref:hypothetical protein n=1 Tax=unclassified Streptomyces TaxID=2593676 RepID=UPI0037F35D95